MKHTAYKLKSNRGFSLLEAILTTIILSVASLGGMTVLQNATLNTVHYDMATQATELASSKLEEIMADHKFKGVDFILDEESYDGSESEINGYPGFTRTVVVTHVDATDLSTPSDDSTLTKVEVTVSWGDSDNESVSTSTLLTDALTDAS